MSTNIEMENIVVEKPSTSSNVIDESEIQNSAPTDEVQARDLCLSKKTSDLIKHHKPIPDECVSPTSPLGNTVLHIAARYQNDDLVEKITRNASHLLHAKNKNGDTALHVAARYGHVSTLRKLFDACILNLPFPYSENPKKAVEETLVRNKQGNTFFHEALLNGHAPKDVRSMLGSKETSIPVGFTELVERVALFRTNNDGKCVLYLAIEGGHKEFVMNALEKLRSQHPALDELIQNRQELVEIISQDIEPPPLPQEEEDEEDEGTDDEEMVDDEEWMISQGRREMPFPIVGMPPTADMKMEIEKPVPISQHGLKARKQQESIRKSPLSMAIIKKDTESRVEICS